MKVLVTGASGFLGKYICNALVAKEGHEVLAISRQHNAGSQILSDAQTDCLHWLTSALTPSAEEISLIQSFEPDSLIHLAWDGIPDFSFQNSVKNLEQQVSFFEQILRIPSIKTLSVSGSCWEYGRDKGACKETDAGVSRDYFTWAKHALHDFLRFSCTSRQITLNWMRVFYVYGPGQRPGALIPSLIHTIKEGKPLEIRSPYNANDFVFAEDVAEAFVLSLATSGRGGVFNIGSGQSVKVLDICEMIERELLGTDTITRELEGRISIPQETVDFWADTNDIKTKLGWKPAVSLSAGIKKTIQVLK